MVVAPAVPGGGIFLPSSGSNTVDETGHRGSRRYGKTEQEESEAMDGILDGAIEAPNSSDGVGSVAGDQVEAGQSDSAGTTGSGVDTNTPSGITGDPDYSFYEFLEGLLSSVGAENEANRKYNTAEAIAGREWSAWEAQKIVTGRNTCLIQLISVLFRI